MVDRKESTVVLVLTGQKKSTVVLVLAGRKSTVVLVFAGRWKSTVVLVLVCSRKVVGPLRKVRVGNLSGCEPFQSWVGADLGKADDCHSLEFLIDKGGIVFHFLVYFH